MTFNFTFASRTILAALSGGMLGVCYLHSGLFLLAWIALVPWLIALNGASPRNAYWLGVILGLSLSAVGSYWVVTFINALSDLHQWQSALLATTYWLITSQILGLTGLLLVWCRRKAAWTFVATLPVLGTIALEFGPQIFPVNLGVTQTGFLLSLQATEITGPAGVVAVMLLTNALVAEAALGKLALRSPALLCSGILLTVWFGYGMFAFWEWEANTNGRENFNIGIVQSNHPASLQIPPPDKGFSYAYPPEMAIYQTLAERGADLVIWPETRFKGYQSLAHVQSAFDFYVREYGAGLLLQDMTLTDTNETFNTAIVLSPTSEAQRYHKIKLIAFGETLPQFFATPEIEKAVKRILGDFYTPLASGNHSPYFQFEKTGWIPLICYDVAFAPFVADSVNNAPAPPYFITVQSNDVWFAGTRQPRLHIATSQLRAIENRLPLVHVINNGPSVVVAPSGRLIFESTQDVRRGYMISVPLETSGHLTFFSRHPALAQHLLFSVALIMLLFVFIRKSPHPPG